MKPYKFYSTDKLKTILDNDRPKDYRAEQTIRAVLLERYKRQNEVITLSIARDEENPDEDQEPSFSSGGCDCCSHGLGNNVYSTIGYSKKHSEVLELGEVCHECICVEAHGID